jgi:hypothetical protein
VIPATVVCMLALPASALGFFETPNHASGHSTAGGIVAAAAGIAAVVLVGGMGMRNFLRSRRIRRQPDTVSAWSGSRAARVAALDRVALQVSADPSSDVVPSRPEAQPDVADELTKLADLRDRGVLTQAEFDAQKGKLLGSE